MLEKVGAKLTNFKNNLKNENKNNLKPQHIALAAGTLALGALDGIESYSNTKLLLKDKFESLKETVKTGAKKEAKNAKKELGKLNFKAIKSGVFGAIKGMGSIVLVAGILYCAISAMKDSASKNSKNNDIQTEIKEAPIEEQTQTLAEETQNPQPAAQSEIEEIKNLSKI